MPASHGPTSASLQLSRHFQSSNSFNSKQLILTSIFIIFLPFVTSTTSISTIENKTSVSTMHTPETRILSTLVESLDCASARNDDINLTFDLKPQADGLTHVVDCQSWIELSIPDDVGTTVEIPFVTPNRFPDNGPPLVLMTINGRYAGDSGVQMDTGSTGITIGKGTWVEWFNGNWSEAVKYERGWKFLSSSKKLYSGHWVPTTLIFHGRAANGTRTDLLKAVVPVLVFDTYYICPKFTNDQGSVCTAPTDQKSGNITGLYMGVGFGREQDGMVMCTPDKNPLLNVYEVNGQNVAGPNNPNKYHLGYIVRSNSLVWGLTPTNINGFRWMSLQKQPNATDYRDWAMATLQVSINNGKFRSGSILADTGVTQMYLSSPDVPKPIPPSYKINLKIPDIQGSLGGYVVTAKRVGGNATADSSVPGTAPAYVRGTNTAGIVSGPGGGVYERVFVNTGSRFWNGFEAAFDAAGGHWGVLEKSTS
ncbi:hypothetical protein TWF225_005297 [Orbilia oligospora]|nr:hypothetical protein TWF225_005297 [Orbilia oligospora]KAF3234475.1 hypothetical protein TWF217_003603 [Orbilia oligospora]KAF3257906.1 hypothetical protein TWF128_004819 [Orbilia oligospora]KAF3257907.1 hypothetical protein TWF128_004819 [Orbilia oligospora]KAF3289226.1 hypothetical protein TWF132_007666 [Orbilia oligospora]